MLSVWIRKPASRGWRGAVEREPHGYRPAAVRLHNSLIAARRHGELRNRGHRQAELIRDELAPRLDLDAIGL
jgi:hypothetical protein